MESSYDSLIEQYASKPDGYYDNQRVEMLPFIPEGVSSLLEVGCSSGAFGAAVKKHFRDCEVWGIEPSPAAAEFAAGRLDKAICGVFGSEMPELEGKRFDCIVFNDVLEHLANPDQTLLICKQYLSEGGSVVASIPNILHFYQISKILLEQDWRYEQEGILDNTHLRFFTKKSIIRLFEHAGYKIEKIEGINPSFGLKYQFANFIALGKLKDFRFVQFAVRGSISA